MATRVDTSYTLVDGDDLVSMERGRVWGPWCRRARRCCGSYLLVGDTHTEHKQQAGRLANAEKRKKVKTGVQGRRLRSGPETPVNLRTRLRRGLLAVPGLSLRSGPEEGPETPV
mgnify:CR=1 FL=1